MKFYKVIKSMFLALIAMVFAAAYSVAAPPKDTTVKINKDHGVIVHFDTKNTSQVNVFNLDVAELPPGWSVISPKISYLSYKENKPPLSGPVCFNRYCVVKKC